MLRFFAIAGLCWIIGSCKPEKKVSIIFGGDVMLDRGVKMEMGRHSLNYLLADVEPQFHNADFVIVNIECPVTNIQSPLTKQFIFRGDPKCLPDLKESGITHGILANNHSYDHGRAALTSTADNLSAAGIVPVGYGSNQREACAPVFLHSNGSTLAIFSSVLIGLESWMYLDGEPGMCQATVDDLVLKIGNFKKENPNTNIILTLHWGNEYELVPPILQKTQARKLIRAGADAIIGHHPHVVQQFEWIEGKPVFYSLGNLLFDNSRPITHQGILAKLTFVNNTIETEVIPYSVNNVKPFLMDSTECGAFVANWHTFSREIPNIRHVKKD